MAKLLDVIRVNNQLGEGPLWNPLDGQLWWTDIYGKQLLRLDLVSRQVRRIATPEQLGSFAFLPGRTDRILAAFESGIGFFDLTGGTIDWIARPDSLGRGSRLNDGRTDRQGRFWVGSMVEDAGLVGVAGGHLYCLDLEGKFTIRAEGVRIGNALSTSPDGATLYFADSLDLAIHQFDLAPASGVITNRRLFASVDRGDPDGSAMDEEGCLWSARWGGSELVRHHPDGRILERLPVPASQPTCVCFGGVDRRLMFVTSAWHGLDEPARSADPQAGDLFIYQSDVAGILDEPYRGRC